MATDDIDFLIVGAGPVGLALALLLSKLYNNKKKIKLKLKLQYLNLLLSGDDETKDRG